MQALCWHDTGDVRIDTVPDPKIIESRDAIVKVTTTAICGSERLDRYANLYCCMDIQFSFELSKKPMTFRRVRLLEPALYLFKE